LSKHKDSSSLYVEWSVNEKVAAESAAAAAIAGLRSIAPMKNAGLSVALDFLTHLSMTGLGNRRGAMVVVVCDDPDGHSSGDETDSRWLARFSYSPLLEPTSISEAKELIDWAFDLSTRFACHVMYRSYTRLSHSSALVEFEDLLREPVLAQTDNSTSLNPYLARPKHAQVVARLAEIRKYFEKAMFNSYEGPENPALIIVSSGNGYSCARDAIELLGLEALVGILKIVTLWPFPLDTVIQHLSRARDVLVAEEVDPFVEVHVKSALVEKGLSRKVYGRESGHIDAYGEITPDRVAEAITRILNVGTDLRQNDYQVLVTEQAGPLIKEREVSWCAGCPHRASFWALTKAVKAERRDIYVTGDIGCYTLDVFPGGKAQMNVLHAMGSGAGLASGFGKLKQFGYHQPVVSICGDSTFFHASIPAVVNAVHNRSEFLLIILDNHTTAMTGFQPHPGTNLNATGGSATPVNLEKLFRSIGCDVTVADPFDSKDTIKTIRRLLRDQGVQVLILRRMCELLRMRQEKIKPYMIAIKSDQCRGVKCAVCTTRFGCPGIVLDPTTAKAMLKPEICSGCGVCAEICPSKAIERRMP
jgi:indolepyruvate ferredoxin oxidoreductase alpha subunit